MKNRSRAALVLVALVMTGAFRPGRVQAQQPTRVVHELIPDSPPASVVRDGMRVSVETGQPLALYGIRFPVTPGPPEGMARQFLSRHAELLRLTSPALDDLEVRAVRAGLTGHTVRFLQLVDGVPVYGAEVAVSINRENLVTFVMNGYVPGIELASVVPRLTQSRARQEALAHLGIVGELHFDQTDLVVYHHARVSRLAWRVRLHPKGPPRGDWEVLVGAETGEVFRVEDKALS